MILFFPAMAFLESAVVVYLRALYYPDGFDFPLVTMDERLVLTEVVREVATMIMLLAPGAMVTRYAIERFAWFCFGFGIWDLFYYIWLKMLLDWPSDPGTMDLLFLIPIPWVGPVWAPCLVSIGLIALALIILYKRGTAGWRIDRIEWSLLILAASIIILSFILDPIDQGIGSDAFSTDAAVKITTYVPGKFAIGVFLVGCATAASTMIRMFVRKGSPRRDG